MTGIYLLVVILGTYLAPITSGYIAVAQEWRWVFWHCAIYMAVTVVVMAFFLEETKWEAPVIMSLPLSHSERCSTTDHAKTSTEKIDPAQLVAATASCTVSVMDNSITLKSYRERHPWYTLSRSVSTAYTKRFLRQLYQPFLILGIFPAVMFSALQYAWSESMLSFLAVTQASLYPLPPYNFSAIGVGNMNIPPAIGAILGSIFGGLFSDYLIMAIARKRRGIYEPEYRLWTFCVPGASMVAGVLLYGLTIAEVSGLSYLHQIPGANTWNPGHAMDHQRRGRRLGWVCAGRLW